MHDTRLQYRNSPSRRVSHIFYLTFSIYHATHVVHADACDSRCTHLRDIAHLSEKFTRKFLAGAVSLKCLDLKLPELNTVCLCGNYARRRMVEVLTFSSFSEEEVRSSTRLALLREFKSKAGFIYSFSTSPFSFLFLSLSHH